MKFIKDPIYNYIPIDGDKYAKCYIMEKLDGDLTSLIIEKSSKMAGKTPEP